jgi:hypothetical protein
MTVKEMKELLNNLPDDAEIEINSIYDKNEECKSSPICEAHYSGMQNKVYITPIIISI